MYLSWFYSFQAKNGWWYIHFSPGEAWQVSSKAQKLVTLWNFSKLVGYALVTNRRNQDLVGYVCSTLQMGWLRLGYAFA
jgi:hypothetical protein